MIVRETAFDDVFGAEYTRAERWLQDVLRTAHSLPDGKKFHAGHTPAFFIDYLDNQVIGRGLPVPSKEDLTTFMNGLLVAIGVHVLRRMSPDRKTGVSMYDFFGTEEMDAVGRWLETKHGRMRPEAGQMQATARKIYADSTLYHFGQKVYDPSPGLAEKLKHTEIRGLRTEDVKVPFSSQYILVPKRTEFKVYNDETGLHPLRGIYITYDPGANTEAGIKMTEEVGAHRLPAWRFLIWGESKNDDPWDDAIEYCTLFLPEGKTLDEAIRFSIDAGSLAKETAQGEVFKWTLNIVLYATMADADIEHVILNPEARSLWERHTRAPKGSKKRQELLERFRDIPNPKRRIVLGRHTTVLETQELIQHRQGRPLVVRTLVQGHWRHYWIGHRGSDERHRIRKWIEPFWRGPEGGEPGSSIHKLV